MKITDEAIRAMTPGRRRWNPDRCRPLQVLWWLVGAMALAPLWIWLAKGVVK